MVMISKKVTIVVAWKLDIFVNEIESCYWKFKKDDNRSLNFEGQCTLFFVQHFFVLQTQCMGAECSNTFSVSLFRCSAVDYGFSTSNNSPSPTVVGFPPTQFWNIEHRPNGKMLWQIWLFFTQIPLVFQSQSGEFVSQKWKGNWCELLFVYKKQ